MTSYKSEDKISQSIAEQTNNNQIDKINDGAIDKIMNQAMKMNENSSVKQSKEKKRFSAAERKAYNELHPVASKKPRADGSFKRNKNQRKREQAERAVETERLHLEAKARLEANTEGQESKKTPADNQGFKFTFEPPCEPAKMLEKKSAGES